MSQDLIKLNNTLALIEHVYSEVHVNQEHGQTQQNSRPQNTCEPVFQSNVSNNVFGNDISKQDQLVDIV